MQERGRSGACPLGFRTPLHPSANFETIGGGAAGRSMKENRDGSRQRRTPMKWMLTMLAAGACAGALTALGRQCKRQTCRSRGSTAARRRRPSP
jgi:hypothetical protein